MNAKSATPLKVTLPRGDTVESRDDLGNLILVAASMRLSSSGVGFFVVTPSFFFSARSVFRQFGDLGLGVEAALALPPGTFAPYTNIPAYLVVVRRKPSPKQMEKLARAASGGRNCKGIISGISMRNPQGLLGP